MPFSSIPDLLDDIRAGRMVVILDDEDRENEGDLIMAASKVRPEDINFMARHARGLICLALTRERCRQLDLPLMVRDNRSQYSTNFTVSIEAAEGVTTGISAYDRAHTIRTAVMPDARPDHLHQPGHIFPLMAQPGGVLLRAGHTEAAVDLAGLAGLEPAGVLVEILAEDGTMARRPQLEAFAAEHGLRVGTIAELIHFRQQHEKTIERVYDQPVQTSFGRFRLVGYRDLIGHELHFALVHGEPCAEDPVLVRVHVKNPLSDVLHLEREDLGIPLSAALKQAAGARCAVVVVLTQRHSPEALLGQLLAEPAPPAQGADWRRHGLGAQILVDLGVRRMRVLGTPRRFLGLGGFGLEVVEYVDAESAARSHA
jgi:3,4-dihydroxy 2-butanone 4-phosphate synthase / GTP cyclohydrolase II